MQRKFVAIASFPRSGNTWVRSILSHLLFNGDIAKIPDKHKANIFAAAGYRMNEGLSYSLYKTHERVLTNTFFQKEVVHAAAIHIRRHPLDVFLSYLNYLLLDDDQLPDSSFARQTPFAFDPGSLDRILEQDILDVFFGAFFAFGTLTPNFTAAGTYFDSNLYWVTRNDDDIPVFRVKYEDLHGNGPSSLMAVAEFFGKTADQLAAAFAKAAEDTKKDGGFFWRQSTGIYKEFLKEEHLRKFERAYGDRMAALGYAV